MKITRHTNAQFEDPRHIAIKLMVDSDLPGSVNQLLLLMQDVGEISILSRNPNGAEGPEVLLGITDALSARRLVVVKVTRDIREDTRALADKKTRFRTSFVDERGATHRPDWTWVFVDREHVRKPLADAYSEVFSVRLVGKTELWNLLDRYTPADLMELERREQQQRIVTLVPNINPQLLEMLRRDPSELSRLSPERFEELIAERLEKMGYVVTCHRTFKCGH